MTEIDTSDVGEDPIRDQLVAYLDGELDAATAEQVEARLASDAAYRDELRRLTVAWDCLDQLPHSTVDEKFAQSTVEMVALSAEQDMAASSGPVPRGRRARQLISGGVLAVSILVGFFASRIMWPDRNELIERDLAVVTNLDLYAQVDDIAFLKLLLEREVFADGGDGRGD